MTSVTLTEAQADLAAVVKRAQTDRVVIEQDGKPVAVVLGIESYDQEDLETASAPEFWRMIGERRAAGKSSPLSDVRSRLINDE